MYILLSLEKREIRPSKHRKGMFATKRLPMCVLFFVLLTVASIGCTGFRVISKDGAIVAARTLQFEFDLGSKIVVAPRDTFMTALTTGWEGLSWNVKYGYVGANSLGMDLVADGINQVGLACGGFYFTGCAGHQPLEKDLYKSTISHYDVIGWILENFATVEEVKSALDDIRVYGLTIMITESTMMPLHYIVYDAHGGCIVIEYVDGELNIHENPLGVITNNPTFDWHLQNLSNYVNLTPANIKSSKLGDFEIRATGNGTGLLGLPGDNTSPSRFVRAAFYSHGEVKPANAESAVTLAWHILNAQDIPEGLVVNEELGIVISRDIAYWSAVTDLTNRVYYYRTYEDLNIRKVELDRIDFSSGNKKF
ncbi:choloylglycine hydrolase family protein [Mesotoga sp. H07pep.5.4]|uniref:choloylglycine hydrolase family protein n=3 Tax=unclassified Mesotoga TaxID=1184398 RepID=UPI00217EE8AF|nr:choloylglycine hydrolase family protein [Mesotoga sp. H07pep.5.4]